MRSSSYIYKDDLLHHLDPRVKLMGILSSVVFFVAVNYLSSLFSFALFLLFLLFLTAGAKGMRRSFSPILFILIVIFIIAPFTYRDGEAFLEISSFTIITSDAIVHSLTIALRLIGISVLFTLLFATERLEMILSALTSFGLSYQMALSMMLSLSYIEKLARRYDEIKEAISLRTGGDGGNKGILDVLTSLIVYTLKNVEVTSSALSEKGYEPGIEVTNLHPLPRFSSIVLLVPLGLICPWIFLIVRILI